MANLSIVLAGGSGFLGTHLRDELSRRGHAVTILTRHAPTGPDQVRWDPYSTSGPGVPQQVVAAADVVVNLAGSPTAGNPHSQKWADELRTSRVTTTRVLAEAIAQAGGRPAFLAGNGISYYGDHGDAVLTETSDTRGHALLTDVTRQWQEATRAAQDAGSRVCILRTAPVMDRRAPPLKQLRLLFLTGGGARLGSGRQYMAMISLRDWVGGVVHLAEHDTASGPFNLTAPEPPTNAEFTDALGQALHRPTVLAVPAPLLRLGAGRMAPELLGSLNVRPAALERTGYTFRDADVRAILAAALS